MRKQKNNLDEESKQREQTKPQNMPGGQFGNSNDHFKGLSGSNNIEKND